MDMIKDMIGDIDRKVLNIIGIAIILLVVVIAIVNIKPKGLKMVRQKYDDLIKIHEFSDFFNIDDEIMTIDNSQYKKIANYNEVLDKHFTKNGKELINENLSKYIMQIDNSYYLKLDELNFETEYKGSKYKKKTITDSKIEYLISTKIKFIDQKDKLKNEITLVKEGNDWKIDNYKLEKYIYQYKN